MTAPTPLGKKYAFLYLEDNPLDVEILLEWLQTSGLNFELTVADSRARFHAAYRPDGYDLILADYSLPDFDGLSALAIVRQTDARLPFIFVSGVLGEEVAIETLLRGATDYVLKQRLDRLLPAVHRALVEHEEHASRERAERELRAIEQRFSIITSSLPAMVWTCAPEGRLTFSNSLWQRMVGAAETWFDPAIVHPSDQARCDEVWRKAQISREAFDVECRYRIRQDGTYRWNLVRAVPLKGSDHAVREWIGTCTDTEQQKARETQFRITEKLALTGRLASVIAHEINNPLEAMTNILFLMRTVGSDEAELQAYLTMAEHELVRISAITKQTLQWSRDEAVPSEVSTASLVEEAEKLFVAKLKNKQVQLVRELEPDIQVRVIGGEIRQVIANLLSNAIDAVSFHGTIVLRTAVETRAGRRLACISVEDNGHGIPPEIKANLFSPFHSTKGDLGTGLGLYVSKQLVENNGGELIMLSEPGRHTLATVYLPLL